MKDLVNKDLVNKIYTLKDNFILVGLTGKTGSGCSTISNILENGYQDYKAVNETDKYIQQKKDRIIKNFASKNFKNKKFYIIKPSTIIMMIFVFEKNIFFNEIESLMKLLLIDDTKEQELKIKCQYILSLYNIFKIFNSKESNFKEEFEDLLSDFQNKNKIKLIEIIKEKKTQYEKSLKNQSLDKLKNDIGSLFELDDKFDNSQIKITHKYKKIKKVTRKKIKNKFQLKIKIMNTFLEYLAKNENKKFIDLYEKYHTMIQTARLEKKLTIETLQVVGDLVRSQVDIFKLPNYINLMVKALRAKAKAKTKDAHCYIAIYSLKNPFEIVFFKERYSAYYTFSVHSKDEIIYSRFSNLDEIKEIHRKEMYQYNTEKQKDSLKLKLTLRTHNK